MFAARSPGMHELAEQMIFLNGMYKVSYERPSLSLKLPAEHQHCLFVKLQHGALIQVRV